MPLFRYDCSCGETLAEISKRPAEVLCPACGKKMERILSGNQSVRNVETIDNGGMVKPVERLVNYRRLTQKKPDDS